jgi:hypothetical protein
MQAFRINNANVNVNIDILKLAFGDLIISF